MLAPRLTLEEALEAEKWGRTVGSRASCTKPERPGQAWEAANVAREPDPTPGSHLRHWSRAVTIMAHFRRSLSNSTGKATHPNAGTCVRNRCQHCHLQRGPLGLESNSHPKTQISLCLQFNPNVT